MISILALLLQTAPPPAPAPAPPPPAPWTVVTRPTSDPTVSATVTSITTPDGNRLAVRCDAGAGAEKYVSVQFRAALPLGGPPPRMVEITPDARSAISGVWQFAAAPQSVAYNADDRDVTAIIAAIAKAKSIKVHTITFAGEPVDVTFAGPPSDAPVKAVLAACGYELGVVPVRAPTKK